MLSSPIAYYPHFEISSKYSLPIPLKDVLVETWNHKYRELYEINADSNISLEEVFNKIIDAIWNEDTPLNSHKRYVWIAYSLGLATQPTVESYLPNEQNVQLVLKQTLRWLKAELSADDCTQECLFPQLSIGSQSIDEAVDVFRNLQIIIKPQSGRTALLEILDDCIEGNAIFPGSEGRRDLFNWLLVEVIPASWQFQSPSFIYDMRQPWPPNE